MSASRFTLPSPPRWAFALVALLVFAFFLRVFVSVWTPEHGITKFLRIGSVFDERGLAVFRATPKYVDPYPAHRWGFDGQLYAEMALDPLLRDPQLHVALDDPPYRGQRILLSWIAWALGFGQPFWILNVYAALNLIFWVGYAWLAAKLFRPHGWAGLAGYAAILATCGIIESMQASLTDLPSFTLILAAIMAGGTAGAGLLALAALGRTPSLIGFVGLMEFPPPWKEAIRKNLVRGLVAAVPVALWVAYVLWRFRGRQISVEGGNLALPFHGIMEKLGEFSVTAVRGQIRWHRLFFEIYKSYDLHALLTIISVVTQTIYVALHREWKSPLWRWGAVVAVYFSCVSFLSWDSHFTVTRHALPLTLVFNLFLAMRPTKAWLIWFLLGNCFVPYGVRSFDALRDQHSPPPPAEFAFVDANGATPATPPVEVTYGDGWSPQQWRIDETSRWARGESATILLHNRTSAPVTVNLRLIAYTTVPRDLRATLGTTEVAHESLARGRRILALAPLTLPPGETHLTFLTSAQKSKIDDDTPGDGTWKIENPRLTLAPPSGPSH